MTKLFVAVVFALTVLMYPMASRADCNRVGVVVRVHVAGTTGPSNFIYMRAPDPRVTSHYFIGRTEEPLVVAAALVAVALQTKTYISGDATSCPTSGPVRSFGNIKALILNP